MDKRVKDPDVLKNPAALIAAIHYALSEKGVNSSVMMPYSTSLYSLGDWFRQLWAESLGKKDGLKKKNIFVGQTPVKALGTTDQHSQVQLYREGPFDKLITFLEVERFNQKLAIPGGDKIPPSLQYLANSTSDPDQQRKLATGTLFRKRQADDDRAFPPWPRNGGAVYLSVWTAVYGRIARNQSIRSAGGRAGKTSDLRADGQGRLCRSC